MDCREGGRAGLPGGRAKGHWDRFLCTFIYFPRSSLCHQCFVVSFILKYFTYLKDRLGSFKQNSLSREHWIQKYFYVVICTSEGGQDESAALYRATQTEQEEFMV